MILKQSSESTMSVNCEIFRKLLTIDELFELYSQIGESIFTCIDIENINKDVESKKNSVQLLFDTSLIEYDSKSQMHYKRIFIDDKASFIAELFEMLLNNYPDAFSFINKGEIQYDETEAKYYIKRNYVELNLSGLIMLLNGMDIIQLKDNYIYFLEKELLRKRLARDESGQRKTSLSELKKKLSIQEQLGSCAEVAAMEYEKKLLILNDISKEPERISIYNVTAGYDIASYMNSTSDVPDKFIEVKSCADDSFSFYISRNELESAKSKRGHYFLYLLNRKTNEFKIISDPYSLLFESTGGNWLVESQIYEIHSIKHE